MHAKISRELTTLEYIILGLLGTAPQSGYSIIATLESGVHRWKAGPGAIYPALKRLEKNEIITSRLEIVTETRSRKMYELTVEGEDLLNRWLKEPPTASEMPDEREIMLVKFLFAESRLPKEEIIELLDAYEKQLETQDMKLQILRDVAMNVATVHQKLIYEAIMMERVLQRRWVRMARRALQPEAEGDNELETVEMTNPAQ